MMLTIHGLPASIKYAELKKIIKDECNIQDFILDSLVSDDQGPGKKMRIGLANDQEGNTLMRRLDGFRIQGNVVRVVPFGQAPPQTVYEQYGNNYQPQAQAPRPWQQPAPQWQGQQPQQFQPPFQQNQSVGYMPQHSQQPQFGQNEQYVDNRISLSQPSPNQGYGYQKSSMPNPDIHSTRNPHVLRDIQVLDTPVEPHSQYRPLVEKPITISKDAFKGPSFGSQHSPDYGGASHISPWAQPSGNTGPHYEPRSYDKRSYHDDKKPEPLSGILRVPEGFPNKPFQRDDHRIPDDKRFEDGRKDYGPRRDEAKSFSGRFDPNDKSSYRRDTLDDYVRKDVPGRRDDDFVKRDGPINRRDGPFGRKDEPIGRKDDPVDRRDDFGKRDGPPGRRDEPFDRKDEPFDRKDEPLHNRDSFGRKDVSIVRRDDSFARKDDPNGRRNDFVRKDESFGRKDDPMGRRDDFGKRDAPTSRRDEPFSRKDEPFVRKDEPFVRKDEPFVRKVEPFVRKDEPIRRDDFDRADFSRKDGPRRDFDNGNRMEKISDTFIKRNDHIQNREVIRGGVRREVFEHDKRDEMTRKDTFDRVNDEGRRVSPRRGSPGPRRSPARGISPGKYKSQTRRSPDRYSASHVFEGKKRYPDRPPIKQVRPAYEPTTPAPNYSGGYSRHNENVQYPVPGRSVDRPPLWQGRDSDMHHRKPEEDERQFSRPSLEPKFRRSPIPRERSPIPRERSPIRVSKGRSASRSPHRSWATEKRGSPLIHDAPPPPSWPGQEPRRYEKDDLRNRDYREDIARHEIKRREDPDTSDVWKVKRPRVEEDFDIPRRGELKPKPYERERMDDRRSERDFFPDRSDDFRKVPDLYDKERREKLMPREDSRRNAPLKDRPKNTPEKFSRPPQVIAQHDIAVEKIADQMCAKHKVADSRVHDELKVTLSLKIHTAFGNRDVVAGDILEWFYRRYNAVEQDEMFEDIANSVPKGSKSKRLEEDTVKKEPPSKVSKHEESIQAKKEKVKAQFKKTIEVIRTRILKEHGYKPTSDNFRPIAEELTVVLLKLLLKIGEKFGLLSPEVLMRKYTQSYTRVDEDRMFEDILKKVREGRREHPVASRKGPSNVAIKVNQPDKPTGEGTAYNPHWELAVKDGNIPMVQYSQIGGQMYPVAMTYPPEHMSQFNYVDPQPVQSIIAEFREDMRYNLFLCKNDFEAINSYESAMLKNFLVSEIFSGSTPDWSPDFNIKGLQSVHRYEVATNDVKSKDWLVNLDFSKFTPFGVLVYSKEELWYERAAIWLPGHSKCKIEPLVKLQLQNKRLEGLSIEKWKFVKKIVTVKGTRIYVDMPPSSARALEKINMKLSYELQKVSVFLKAVAVDKDVFDSGLKDFSISDSAQLATAIQNAPMPVLSDNVKLVKICFKGNKMISALQAKKIKEMIIFKIFKYHQEPHSKCRTDFEKYGFCQPGYFVVLPENDDSRKWITRLVDIGKLNKHEIIVLNSQTDTTKYFKMSIELRKPPPTHNSVAVVEKLKQSNKGIRGLNFEKWKFDRLVNAGSRYKLRVEVDMDSVEKLKKMRFRLDYGNDFVIVDHKYDNIDKLIRQHKSELQDSYDVANMEIDSGDDSDNEVITLD